MYFPVERTAVTADTCTSFCLCCSNWRVTKCQIWD